MRLTKSSWQRTENGLPDPRLALRLTLSDKCDRIRRCTGVRTGFSSARAFGRTRAQRWSESAGPMESARAGRRM